MANRKKNREQKDKNRTVASIRSEIITYIETNHTFRTIRETEELLYFDPSDGQWKDGDTFLKEFVRKKAGSYFTTNLFREIRLSVMVDAYISKSDFVSPKEWINVKNGSLNVLTSEFIPRVPEPECQEEQEKIKILQKQREDDEAKMQENAKDMNDFTDIMERLDRKYEPLIKELRETIRRKKHEWRRAQTEKFANFQFTSSLPVSFYPSATCPRIGEFFKNLEIGAEMTVKIHELFGYCLYKSYPLKKMFLFEGPNDTGKGAVASLLEALLGENYSALSLDAIQEDRFEKYKLYGKYANISGELASKFIKDTSLIKELLGSDSISVRLMHTQKEFKFRNHAKLIFLANQIPATYDTDDAFYPKVELFEFRKQFPEGSPERIEHDQLMAELTTDQELSGLLNKSLKALQGLLKRGKFTASRSAEENKEIYLIRSNPFKYYIEEALEFDAGEKTVKSEAYANYALFCQQYGVPVMTDNMFFKLLNRYLSEHGIIQKRDDGGRGIRYYPGVRIRNLWGGMGDLPSDP